MKTTIEISDNLLARARRLAQKEKSTLRSITEEGIERVLNEREQRKKSLIKPVTFKGEGLSPEFRDAGWNQVRDTAYEGRGS